MTLRSVNRPGITELRAADRDFYTLLTVGRGGSSSPGNALVIVILLDFLGISIGFLGAFCGEISMGFSKILLSSG